MPPVFLPLPLAGEARVAEGDEAEGGKTRQTTRPGPAAAIPMNLSVRCLRLAVQLLVHQFNTVDARDRFDRIVVVGQTEEVSSTDLVADGFVHISDPIPVLPGVGHSFGHVFLAFLLSASGHQGAPQERGGVECKLGERVDRSLQIRHSPLGLSLIKGVERSSCENRIAGSGALVGPLVFRGDKVADPDGPATVSHGGLIFD